MAVAAVAVAAVSWPAVVVSGGGGCGGGRGGRGGRRVCGKRRHLSLLYERREFDLV